MTSVKAGNQKKVYVGIEYYVDDPEPRVNDVKVFKKKTNAEAWQSEAHSRDIHESVLE